MLKTIAARVHVRWMIRRDMPEVLAIEAAGGTLGWTEEEFCARLRGRHCIGMVAEKGERVVGFMVYEIRKGRYELTNFVVHPDHRRQTVGWQLMAKMVGKLSPHRPALCLTCPDTLLRFHLFLRDECGFRCTGIVWGNETDGYRFVRRLDREATERGGAS